ncbi:MAG: PHP domain-containing protein [Dehalococcoidales bacterium]
MLKADLHIHTEYSMDCTTPLEKIINRCLELGINCIAIADHGTIEGALKMQSLAPFTVIVAEEMLTPHGEIMGIFLKEAIPSGLSIEQTISRIRAQGGLVCIPHGFDIFRPSALGSKIVEELAEQIDIMEVFNARSPLLRSSAKALAFAQKYDIAKSAGSDAHTVDEIGNAYVEMAEFDGKDEFLQALANGKIHGHRTNPLTHFSSAWAKLKTRFSSRG